MFWASACLRGNNSRLTEALQRLRKVLALERSRKFADTAVIGGLDAYLEHFLSETPLPSDHRFQQVLRALPPRGYRALHPVQRLPERLPHVLLPGVRRGADQSAVVRHHGRHAGYNRLPHHPNFPHGRAVR